MYCQGKINFQPFRIKAKLRKATVCAVVIAWQGHLIGLFIGINSDKILGQNPVRAPIDQLGSKLRCVHAGWIYISELHWLLQIKICVTSVKQACLDFIYVQYESD